MFFVMKIGYTVFVFWFFMKKTEKKLKIITICYRFPHLYMIKKNILCKMYPFQCLLVSTTVTCFYFFGHLFSLFLRHAHIGNSALNYKFSKKKSLFVLFFSFFDNALIGKMKLHQICNEYLLSKKKTKKITFFHSFFP